MRRVVGSRLWSLYWLISPMCCYVCDVLSESILIVDREKPYLCIVDITHWSLSFRLSISSRRFGFPKSICRDKEGSSSSLQLLQPPLSIYFLYKTQRQFMLRLSSFKNIQNKILPQSAKFIHTMTSSPYTVRWGILATGGIATGNYNDIPHSQYLLTLYSLH